MGEIDFETMCDGCFRFMMKGEDKFGIHVVDDNGVDKVFKGHKECMTMIRDRIEEQKDK